MNDFKVLLQAVLDASNIGRDDIDKVQKVIDKYHLNLTADLDKATMLAEIKKIVPQLEAELKKMTGIDIKISDTAILKSINQLDRELDRVTSKSHEIQLSLSSGDFETKILGYETSLKKLGLSANEVSAHMKGINTALSDLKTSATGDNIIPDDVASKAKILETEMTKLSNTVKQVRLKDSLNADDLKVESTIARLNEQIRKNSAYSKEAKKQVHGWIAELEKGNIAESRLKEINVQAKSLHANMAQLNKIGFSWTDKLKQGFSKIGGWSFISGGFVTALNTLRKIPQEVKELDSAQVELVKVSDLTAEGLENVTNKAFEMGGQVAKTGTQVLDAITEFKRAGYEMNESINMSEAAMVMTNVADGINNTSDAAGTLIATLKGFKMDESDIMSIVDKMNSVSNQSPVSFDNLADGLERVSGTMYQAGNSIDDTLGLLTGGFAQLRNMEKVSSGLVTIGMRLRGVGEDGEVIDGLSAKLQEDFSKIGVAIEDQNGNLRSTTAIIKDYAKVLPELTSKQKQYYGELAAGKRQITVWDAITSSIGDVDNAINQSINSVGSAAKENEAYLDSVQGKITDLSSAGQELANHLLDSDTLKNFIEFGTETIRFIDTVTDKIGVLGALAGGAGIFAGLKNVGGGNYISNLPNIVYCLNVPTV